MEQLLRGWNWVSVEWLYGWMIKTHPINNDCVRLNGKDGDCLDCPAAYRRGDMIIWLVDGLKRALASEEGLYRAELARYEGQAGFEWLKQYALTHSARKVTVLSDGMEVNEEDVAILQPIEALIWEPIKVVMDNKRPYITDGRHRVCAAYQFGVADLPIWIEEL